MREHPLIEEVLISEEEVKAKVKELAKRISEDYANKDLVLVALLKGSVVYLADLMREMTIDCLCDFMVASSYGRGTVSSGTLNIVKDLSVDIKGKDVLLVEDIVDSGITLNMVSKMLKERNPRSLEITTLLTKPSRRQVELDVKYCGFTIPDKFVVGYGLDFDDKYRGFVGVGVLKEEAYKN